MTLPKSGAIKFSDIKKEFGSNNPYSITINDTMACNFFKDNAVWGNMDIGTNDPSPAYNDEQVSAEFIRTYYVQFDSAGLYGINSSGLCVYTIQVYTGDGLTYIGGSSTITNSYWTSLTTGITIPSAGEYKIVVHATAPPDTIQMNPATMLGQYDLSPKTLGLYDNHSHGGYLAGTNGPTGPITAGRYYKIVSLGTATQAEWAQLFNPSDTGTYVVGNVYTVRTDFTNLILNKNGEQSRGFTFYSDYDLFGFCRLSLSSFSGAPNQFVIGDKYKIVSVGNMDWNYIANTTGITYSTGSVFTAQRTEPSTVTTGDILVSGKQYTIKTLGSINWNSIATSSTNRSWGTGSPSVNSTFIITGSSITMPSGTTAGVAWVGGASFYNTSSVLTGQDSSAYRTSYKSDMKIRLVDLGALSYIVISNSPNQILTTLSAQYQYNGIYIYRGYLATSLPYTTGWDCNVYDIRYDDSYTFPNAWGANHNSKVYQSIYLRLAGIALVINKASDGSTIFNIKTANTQTISLGNYYRGGGYIASHQQNLNIPTSKYNLSAAEFRGTSRRLNFDWETATDNTTYNDAFATFNITNKNSHTTYLSSEGGGSNLYRITGLCKPKIFHSEQPQVGTFDSSAVVFGMNKDSTILQTEFLGYVLHEILNYWSTTPTETPPNYFYGTAYLIFKGDVTGTWWNWFRITFPDGSMKWIHRENIYEMDYARGSHVTAYDSSLYPNGVTLFSIHDPNMDTWYGSSLTTMASFFPEDTRSVNNTTFNLTGGSDTLDPFYSGFVKNSFGSISTPSYNGHNILEISSYYFSELSTTQYTIKFGNYDADPTQSFIYGVNVNGTLLKLSEMSYSYDPITKIVTAFINVDGSVRIGDGQTISVSILGSPVTSTTTPCMITIA